MLVAQYWGKGEPAEIRKVLSIVYRISVCISLLFSLGALCCPEIIMSIFTNDAEVIAAGCRYLTVIGWVYPLYALGNNTIRLLRAVGTVRISLVVYSTSFVVMPSSTGYSSSATLARPVWRSRAPHWLLPSPVWWNSSLWPGSCSGGSISPVPPP